MHSVKYYNVKFSQRVYKEADEYRSLSLVALNANCNRKTARQDASAEKRFSITRGNFVLDQSAHLFTFSLLSQSECVNREFCKHT